MKEKDLDKDTIVAYHGYLQQKIRSELNGPGLGPGYLPCRIGIGLVVFGVLSFLTGILLIALRHRHVYLVDWNDQFLGPFFIILWLLCMGAATYLIIMAKRRANAYRRELYFRPLGDYGVAVVHKSHIAKEQELKHELKSGTTPHKKVLPRSEAYSNYQPRKGHDNRAYDYGGDPRRPPDDRRRPPDDRRRPPDDRRRPPDDRPRRPPDDRDRRRPPDDRRRPPDDRDRRGPPDDRDRRRPPPDGRRPPDDRDRPRRPPDDRERRGPPDDRRRPPPGDRRGPPPDDRRRPPPGDRHGPPPDDRRGPPPDDRRGPPPDDRRRPPDSRPGPPPGLRPPPSEEGSLHPSDVSFQSESRGPPPGVRMPPIPGEGRPRPPPDARGPARGRPNLGAPGQPSVVLDPNFGKAGDSESEL